MPTLCHPSTPASSQYFLPALPRPPTFPGPRPILIAHPSLKHFTSSAAPSVFILLPFFILETLSSFVMHSNARHLHGQLFFVSTLYGSFFLLGFQKGGNERRGESNSPGYFQLSTCFPQSTSDSLNHRAASEPSSLTGS